MNFIAHNIDLIWIPLGLVIVHKRHYGILLATLISGMVMMRMQSELMDFIEYPRGIFNFTNMLVYMRLMIFYNLMYAGFITFLHFSKMQDRIIILATAGSLFFGVVIISTLSMIL